MPSGRSAQNAVWKIVGAIATVVALLVVGIAGYTAMTREEPAYVGSYTPTPPPPLPGPPALVLPENPRVLFIGDSFTEGHGADDEKTRGFAPRLAAMRGWTDFQVNGVGLTGFLRPGHVEEAQNTYRQRLERLHRSGEFVPNLIVFQGGLNDSRYGSLDLTIEVRDTLLAAKEWWPGVQLLVIGPITYRSSLAPINAAYKRGALIAEVPFIDANSKPIIPETENVNLTVEDRWHPNDAGHQLVAETLSTRIDELVHPAESNR